MNDLARLEPAVRAAVDEAVGRVLASGRYVLGPEGSAFEAEFAAYCGRRHAVGVANGTDALELALRAAGCGPGHEVVTAANAGFYATVACLAVGATPVFADVDQETLTLAPASLGAALSERTRAVVLTHLYGRLADVEGVSAVLAGGRVTLVEDCAHAHGARRGARRAGAFGDLACFSFYPSKNLGAVGDAGAVLTDRADLVERLRCLRQYGWTERGRSVLPGGRNSRLDELQAAVLRAKLAFLDGWNERRRAIADRLKGAAAGTALRYSPSLGPEHVAHLAVGRHPDREAFRRRLAERGVATAVHYPVADHRQEALRSAPWRSVDLGVTEAAQPELVTLPCFPEMTEPELAALCDAVRDLA